MESLGDLALAQSPQQKEKMNSQQVVPAPMVQFISLYYAFQGLIQNASVSQKMKAQLVKFLGFQEAIEP